MHTTFRQRTRTPLLSWKESEEINRPSVLPICLSRSAASSGVARGRTPGSLKLVRSRVPITKKKRIPPIAGIAGVIFSDKYGQLKEKGKRQNNMLRPPVSNSEEYAKINSVSLAIKGYTLKSRLYIILSLDCLQQNAMLMFTKAVSWL